MARRRLEENHMRYKQPGKMRFVQKLENTSTKKAEIWTDRYRKSLEQLS